MKDLWDEGSLYLNAICSLFAELTNANNSLTNRKQLVADVQATIEKSKRMKRVLKCMSHI